MTRLRAALTAAGAAGLLGGLACATSLPAASDRRPCEGLAAPRVIAVRPLQMPASFVAARLGAEMPVEVIVGRDGSTGAVALRTSDLGLLAPFAEETVKRARFTAGTFEGNPVAVRVGARVPVGVPNAAPNGARPAEVWAFVAGGESREARWQLRDSVSRLVLVAYPGRAAPQGSTVVAVASGGEERTLLTLPPATSAQETRQTIATGKFFASPGEYRVELRSGDHPIAVARFTIAADANQAVVNACEPVAFAFRKTGPGK